MTSSMGLGLCSLTGPKERLCSLVEHVSQNLKPEARHWKQMSVAMFLLQSWQIDLTGAGMECSTDGGLVVVTIWASTKFMMVMLATWGSTETREHCGQERGSESGWESRHFWQKVWPHVIRRRGC